MLGLILKSPYIQCDKSNKSISGYMKYIATRERVELLPDDSPPTQRQTELIQKLVKDFPDSKELTEYEDYLAQPTKYLASAFIHTALECNWSDAVQSDVYMKYIATRPRVEKLGSHGLFGDEETVNLGKTMEKLDSYTGRVWTHILSLKREDAERLGFDNAHAWRDLLRLHRNDIAAAMKIPPNHFRWYAAFHDEGDHPHVHLMAWSSDPKEGYLNQVGIRSIRSKLTNDIFRQEMYSLYEEKSTARDELVQEARESMQELIRTMRNGVCELPEAETLMLRLASELKTVKGKKTFAYLPKEVKQTVNDIVDQMARLRPVREYYERWQELQGQVENYYTDREPVRKKLSEQKEFRAIKNAVIQQALHLDELTFEDSDMESMELNEEPMEDVTRMAWELWEIVQDESVPFEERLKAAEEVTQLAQEGDAWAQYTLGWLYEDGNVLMLDEAKAAQCYETAAQQSISAAQLAASKLYLSNDAEVQNIERGIHWLTKAAENENAYAAYRLAKEYLTGNNIPQDTKRAEWWFTQAAQSRNEFAQYALGKGYLFGKDLPHDQDRAVYWLEQAASQGNTYAESLLERVHDPERASAFFGVCRLLHHMSRIFADNSLPKSNLSGVKIDHKRLKKLRQKRIAMGHKPDDHPDYGMSMN